MTKRFVTAVATTLAVCASSLAHAQANGPAPTLNIVSPTAAGGTIYLPGFPATVPIDYTVQMNGTGDQGMLKHLVTLNVLVNDVSLYGTADGLNAFDNSSNCTGVATTWPNVCTKNDNYNASLRVPWMIAGVGSYTIVVSGKFRGAVGMDTEVVTVAQIIAEYPAPPAVANAYINSGQALSMSGKQRGCVISKIAEQHGKYEVYGPKGGPYNEDAIKAAVNAFVSTCPAR